MTTLKDYLNGHTEEELQKRHEGRCIEASSECLCYVDGYTDGTKETLDMVMREIEQMEGLNSLLSRDQALSTLKQKLLTNIK